MSSQFVPKMNRIKIVLYHPDPSDQVLLMDNLRHIEWMREGGHYEPDGFFVGHIDSNQSCHPDRIKIKDNTLRWQDNMMRDDEWGAIPLDQIHHIYFYMRLVR